MSVRENLDRLFAELPASPPTVVAVSKYATLTQIAEAYDWGIRDFGENKMQDLLAKIPQFAPDIRWHFLGHLQRNKVRKTLDAPLHLIHSVDSATLAAELSTRHAALGQTQAVLLQANLTDNADQSGLSAAELKNEFPAFLDLPGIKIEGLMVIGPATSDAAEIIACFQGLRDLRDALSGETGHPLPTLSMGMSGDFHHALNCGATILRIGNGIFRSP